jgi:hypothetical protein
MKSTYDKSKKVLTITFKHKELCGFDIKGLPVYRVVERTQTFMGMNKQECVLRAKYYIQGDSVLNVRNCRYNVLHVR